MSEKEKVPITERALLKRINRSLAEDGQMVRKTRALRRPWIEYPQGFGPFHRHDLRRNFVLETDLDLEGFAREIGILREGEQMAG